jgi:hypothetical protein
MTPAKKSTRSNIVAEVWSRAVLAARLESGTNPEPVSRHRSVEAAQRQAHYYNLHSGADYVVYARVPDSPTFVELVSWKAGIKTRDESSTWIYNARRFADRLEAADAASDIRSRWTSVTGTVVAPSPEPANYRWDDDLWKAVPLDVPFPWCESCQSYHHPANPACKLIPVDNTELAQALGAIRTAMREPTVPQDAPPTVPTPDPIIDSLTSVMASIEQDVLDACQDAPPALPAVEQALRDAGVEVESPDDPTEATRRILAYRRNTEAPAEGTREYWEAKYGAGNVWSTTEVSQAFEILQFAAPFVFARRQADGAKGLLEFCHCPRYYFDFRPEEL